MSMSEATAIRRVVREVGYDKTNREISEEVKCRYGLDVGANQIIEVLGPLRDTQGAASIALRVQLVSDYSVRFGALVSSSENAFCVSHSPGLLVGVAVPSRQHRPTFGVRIKSWASSYDVKTDCSGIGYGPTREVVDRQDYWDSTRKRLENSGLRLIERAPRRNYLLASEKRSLSHREVKVCLVSVWRGGLPFLTGHESLGRASRSNPTWLIGESASTPEHDNEKARKIEKKRNGTGSSTTNARARDARAMIAHVEGPYHA